MADEKHGMPKTLAQSSCYSKPAMHSNGYWSSHSWTEILHHPVPLLELQLAAVFFLHCVLYKVLKRLNLPSVVIQVSAGMILGNCLRTRPELLGLLFDDDAEDVINGLTTMAHFLFIFSVAVKMDVSTIKKAGINAWAIGVLSFAVPLAVSWKANAFLGQHWPGKNPPPLDAFALIQSVVQFAVVVTLLIDLKILNSELGRLSSSAALINYCVGVSMQVFLLWHRLPQTVSKSSAVKNIVLSGSFIAVIVLLGRPLMLWIIKRTPEGKPVKETYVNCILGLAFLVTMASDAVGLEYRFGCFVLGLVIPAGPPLGSTLANKLDTFILGMLMPLLMTYAGYRMKLNLDFDYLHVLGMCFIILLNFLMKLAVIVLPARFYKLPYKDAFVVTLILCAKGTVEIALYTVTNSRKQISDSFFVMAVMSYLITATVISYAVSRLYDPSRKYASYQRRNILSCPRNAELRILTCIHRQDDALATIKLLETYNPTKHNPLSIFVLHLVDLVGRATPLLIDHQQHTKVSSYSPHLQHIINFFNYYKDQNKESVDAQVFTSVSSHKFMQDDISSVGFDKLASLIILPFHKKWNAKGRVILEDAVVRSINCQVLQRAPCSVGVLVDRRKVYGPSSLLSMGSLHHVALLFLGGEDDREALAFGKRMARSPRVQLTVVRLTPVDDVFEDEWEKMLNAELLKGLRLESSRNGNVLYKEMKVRDGSDTTAIIRSMESKFELIIVGCRHRPSTLTSGLADWSEFPELGPIGDLLASLDIESPVSVLVVQQQRNLQQSYK